MTEKNLRLTDERLKQIKMIKEIEGKAQDLTGAKIEGKVIERASRLICERLTSDFKANEFLSNEFFKVRNKPCIHEFKPNYSHTRHVTHFMEYVIIGLQNETIEIVDKRANKQD